MSKEEYAQLHYLLAKIKYELVKDKFTTEKEKIINMCNRQISAIEEIEKLCIIDFGDDKKCLKKCN